MELILTGSSINAKELEQSGLVNKTFPRETLLDEATTLATKVASMSGAVTRLAKQAILTCTLGTLCDLDMKKKATFSGDALAILNVT